MANSRRRLSIGIQTFSEIINRNLLYIDKTGLIHQLITAGKVYFLSRPRRFGKSLLISTLKAIFKGQKALFNGLAIYQTDYDWQTYPVIHLDMSKLASKTPEALEESLIAELTKIADDYGINTIPNTRSIAIQFNALIEQLATRGKVVVLIDEYDKPLINQIHHTDVAKIHREILRDFYTILKAQDANLHFVLLTGVSAQQALQQIKNNGYANKYADRQCILIGVNFNTKERNITDWLVE